MHPDFRYDSDDAIIWYREEMQGKWRGKLKIMSIIKSSSWTVI
jgi:hypothetical protein